MSEPKIYKTKQREFILDFLMENSEVHLTADDILTALKKDNVSVGKSTVYRYLDKLVEEGTVRKYIGEEGVSACYQYSASKKCVNHFHLKCVRCNKLFHLECEYLDEIEQHILKHHKFNIDNSKTVFYGICENCS